MSQFPFNQSTSAALAIDDYSVREEVIHAAILIMRAKEAVTKDSLIHELNGVATCLNDAMLKISGKNFKFKLGDEVRKTKGAEWQGTIVGMYSTTLNPEGYAVESFVHQGSVQIYPASMLELVTKEINDNPIADMMHGMSPEQFEAWANSGNVKQPLPPVFVMSIPKG